MDIMSAASVFPVVKTPSRRSMLAILPPLSLHFTSTPSSFPRFFICRFRVDLRKLLPAGVLTDACAAEVAKAYNAQQGVVMQVRITAEYVVQYAEIRSSLRRVGRKCCTRHPAFLRLRWRSWQKISNFALFETSHCNLYCNLAPRGVFHHCLSKHFLPYDTQSSVNS